MLDAGVAVISVALVVAIWYQVPSFIVTLFDFNLQLIKFGCYLLPAPYGAMAESALRGALAADKALLFAEGALAVRMLLWGVRGIVASIKTAQESTARG